MHDKHIRANDLAIMTLSLALGVITPLLARRTYDGIFGPRRSRLLHNLNAAHNLLYFILTLSTILVKIFIPAGSDCWAFRFGQGLLFHVYLITYEVVIGIKAKAIIGNRIIIRFADLSVGTTLLLVSLSIRAFTTVMSVWHAEYEFSEEYRLCVNNFHQQWQDLSNYTRNILEIFWSALFVIPLYRVVRDSKKAGAVAIVQGDVCLPTVGDSEKIGSRHPSNGAVLSKSATAMRHLLVSSMIFPFCASLISIALSIYMNLETDVHPGYASIMHGAQNFVSTLSLNLILNTRVAKNEPVHDDCDHVRTYNQRETRNPRYRDNESFEEWDSTDHETSLSESRKPSVVSNQNFSKDINRHVGDNDSIMPMCSSRRPSCIPQHCDITPASSRRSSLTTMPRPSPGLQNSTNTVNSSATLQSTFPLHQNSTTETLDGESFSLLKALNQKS